MTDSLLTLAHSRRTFLRNLAILGATTAAPLAWPGIGLAQETPKAGGILSLVTSGDPPNFDPFSNNSSFVLHVCAACYNSLLMMDPDDPTQIVGDLATGWTQSDDGLTYTFTLVQNARFHDGVPLTAADVKHTFDIVRAPPEGVVSSRKALLAAVKQIDVVDDYTVTFVLSRPSPGLIASLATGWFVVAPKHILEVKGTMAADVIGSGPFKFKEFIPGTSYEMERNTDYHVADRPFLDGLKYYIVPDAGTRLAYLRTGQIDLYDGISGKDARAVSADVPDAVTVYSTNSYIGDPFTMNSARVPFDNINVRKAMALAVDHPEALRVLMQDDGVVGGHLVPGHWGMSAEELAQMPGYGPDIEASRTEARRLLAEAGYPDGFETTLTARKAAGTHEDRALFLADQFAKIGVTAKLQIQESAVYFDTMNGRQFDVATNVISALSDDPDFLIGPFHTTDGALNYSGVSVPEIDALFDQQTQETDPARRLELARQLEVASMNAFGTVVLYYKGKFVVTSARVRGYVMHPEPDNNRRYQNVWLSDSYLTPARLSDGPHSPEATMTLPNGLDHIDIVVEDVAQMRGFFEAVGFTVIRETDHGGGAVELRFPGPGDQPILELTPRIGADGSARPLGLRHMALRVADIQATLADYAARGLHPTKPPRVVAETGRRLANILDPAGNALQFVEG